jgi:hypothetical protein
MDDRHSWSTAQYGVNGITLTLNRFRLEVESIYE